MTTTEITGYRLVEDLPSVGDVLPHSYVWSGDDWTDESLPGTCAFEALDDAREYGKWSMGFWIVALSGAVAARGDLDGEVIIRDATVIEIVEQITPRA